jgi:exosortase C (VPDSG-CTERM-specific)
VEPLIEQNKILGESGKPVMVASVESGANSLTWLPRRFLLFVLFIAALTAAFAVPLRQLVRHAAHSNLHSYILLVPFVSAYLVYVHWRQLPRRYSAAPGWALFPAALGLVNLALAWRSGLLKGPISYNDHLSLLALAFVCFIGAGAFLFLGSKWMRAAAFPIAFLIFFVPLPDAAADYLENASKLASTEAANALFALTGTPVLREGTVFQLPGIVVEVAKECSGIRSSLVLFITSLLASYLFLRSPWRRAALVAAVIPLGIIRNGFRILTIALLCVHFGPHMINTPIHRRGGPIFFVASLVPLFLLLWWLRRGEVRDHVPQKIVSGPAAEKAPAELQ